MGSRRSIAVALAARLPSGAPAPRTAYCRLPLGAIAQLGERVLCKHEVVGSIPSGSTRNWDVESSFDEKSLPVVWRFRNAFFRERGLGRSRRGEDYLTL
jgi:hypothetical protein